MPPLPLALLIVITREAVGTMLRHDLPIVATASIFVSAGMGTTVLYRLRERSRDRALLAGRAFRDRERLFVPGSSYTNNAVRGGRAWCCLGATYRRHRDQAYLGL